MSIACGTTESPPASVFELTRDLTAWESLGSSRVFWSVCGRPPVHAGRRGGRTGLSSECSH
jgi:hypothetical protein